MAPHGPLLLLTSSFLQFSYTGPAVENMYKNAELFERMAIKFSGKILFCKNVVCRCVLYADESCETGYGKHSFAHACIQHACILLSRRVLA